jgi:hypothetical protein
MDWERRRTAAEQLPNPVQKSGWRGMFFGALEVLAESPHKFKQNKDLFDEVRLAETRPGRVKYKHSSRTRPRFHRTFFAVLL